MMSDHAYRHILSDDPPPGPIVVISGDTYDIYAYSLLFLWKRCNADDLCLYSTLSRTVDDIQQELMNRRWDVTPYLQNGILKIIDYLALAETQPGTPEARIDAVWNMPLTVWKPERFHRILTTELHAMRRRYPNRRFYPILDSVDKLVMAFGIRDTLRFASMVAHTLLDANGTSIGLLDKDALASQQLAQVKRAVNLFIPLNPGWMTNCNHSAYDQVAQPAVHRRVHPDDGERRS